MTVDGENLDVRHLKVEADIFDIQLAFLTRLTLALSHLLAYSAIWLYLEIQKEYGKNKYVILP